MEPKRSCANCTCGPVCRIKPRLDSSITLPKLIDSASFEHFWERLLEFYGEFCWHYLPAIRYYKEEDNDRE